MADLGNIDALKAEIDANIVPFNNLQLITGDKLNVVLKDMADTLNAIMSLFITDEPGFFVVDDNLNVGMKYDGSGLDFAQISSHAIQVLNESGVGGGTIDVAEQGLFFVDSQMNVGAKIDSEGLHAINMLEYEIVNS